MPETKLDENTKLPLNLVALIVVTALGVAGWLQTTLFGLQSKIDRMASDLDRVREKLDSTNGEAVNHAEFHAFVDNLRQRNPTLSVPDVAPRAR